MIYIYYTLHVYHCRLTSVFLTFFTYIQASHVAARFVPAGQAFMKEAKERGMNGLEGHPVSGRTRSSFSLFSISISINVSYHVSCPIPGC